MAYSRQTWINGAGGGTPLSAARLTHIEDGLAALSSEAYNVVLEGAAGNNVDDDSDTLNNIFALGISSPIAVMFPAGKLCRVTKNIFIPGSVDLFFGPGAGIVLDADLDDTSVGRKFFINLGLSAKGSPAHPWSGRWSGGNIVATANAYAQRMVQVHSGQDYYFEDLVFDLTAATDQEMSGIGAYNDATWCPNPFRANAHIDRVHVYANQGVSGGEGIGHGSCDGLWVRDCYVNGVGDDPLGIHSCSNVHVFGFTARSTHGRIYISNPTSLTINGFYAERIAKPDDTYVGGGGLFEVTIEDPGGPAPSRIEISNGELVLPNGIPSSTYMMRMRGMRKADISNVQFNCNTSNHNQGISLEAVTVSGWSDPAGLDGGTKARLRDVTVRNCHSIGSVDVSVQQTGIADDFVSPVTIDNCTVGGPLLYTAGVTWTTGNRIKSDNPALLDNLHGQCVPNPSLLFEGPMALVDGFVTQKLTREIGITRWYPHQSVSLKSFTLELAADQTAGDVFVEVSKNGGALQVIGTQQAAVPRGQRIYFYQLGANGYLSPTDYIEISTRSTGLTPTPLNARGKLWGIYL